MLGEWTRQFVLWKKMTGFFSSDCRDLRRGTCDRRRQRRDHYLCSQCSRCFCSETLADPHSPQPNVRTHASTNSKPVFSHPGSYRTLQKVDTLPLPMVNAVAAYTFLKQELTPYWSSDFKCITWFILNLIGLWRHGKAANLSPELQLWVITRVIIHIWTLFFIWWVI